MASTDRDGTQYTRPTQGRGPIGNVANVGICVALAGSGINPVPHYMLACYDTLGVRNYWVDTAVSMTRAPTPAGGATYTDTLVVEGAF